MMRFAEPDPEQDTPFTAYDIKWAISYAFIAWAMVLSALLPLLLLYIS